MTFANKGRGGVASAIRIFAFFWKPFRITGSYAAFRAADLDWILGQDTVRVGTFWGVLNVSFCASGTQLGLVLTCFVVRHPSSVAQVGPI